MNEIVKSKAQRLIGLSYLFSSLFFMSITSRFPRIYSELIGRENIPRFSKFITESNPYFWFIFGFIPGIILILSDRKELNKPITWVCLICFLMIILGITIIGLFIPLIGTVEKIN